MLQPAIDGNPPEMLEQAAGNAEAVIVLLDKEGNLGGVRRKTAVAPRGDDNFATIFHEGDK